ncbi:MAG: GTP-binding protein [Deltaproteobacteria bacterium]|nr:MAG: GTP-binding protein [Deltaproteobacteria bacterium]
MIRKKICMLGAYSVGKTSLVQRFVNNRFPRRYQSTIGVMIDKKIVNLAETEVYLMLWDIYGQDEFRNVQTSYLAGAAGYLLVADGTREDTLDTAVTLRERVEAEVGRLPFVLALNKWDLREQWKIRRKALERLLKDGWSVVRTSARTGDGVEDMFLRLTSRILESSSGKGS